MSSRNRFAAIVAAVGLSFSASVLAGGASPDAMKAQAKITEADARVVALAKVPGGTVQTAELENEHGKLVWSFDIKDPKSSNVIEVQVDAKKGQIVSTKVETPAEQAKEAKADKLLKH